jgi:hypothetical protein
MNLIEQRRLPASVILFLVLFAACWPLYQYIFDVDGIGYAAVAQHYADGNFIRAVNGFWSPMHSWLVIPFLKLGIQVAAAFKITSGIISACSLISLHSLLQKFELTERSKTLIQFTAVIILLHYTYYELAADVLFVFILLVYFNLCLSKSFYSSINKNILAGLLGSLLYFSKTYGFPFFLFHFTLIHLSRSREKNKSLAPYLTGIASFLLLAFPWLTALHWKYGEWVTPFDKYNDHWHFSGNSLQAPIMQGPPHEGSAAVWEDPWHVRSNNLKNISFLQLVIHQIRTMVFNTQQLLKCFHELSFLAPAILIVTTVNVLMKKKQHHLFLLVAMLTLPAGYILLHLETRFIWALSFILMIAGAGYFEQWLAALQLKKWQQYLLWLIFYSSFLLYPIDKLKDTAFEHKEFYTTAAVLKEKQITGSFTSNTKIAECMVIAWYGKMEYYRIVKSNFTGDELLTEMKQRKVRHYFYYYKSQMEKEMFLTGKIAGVATSIKEPEPGLIVASLF